MSASPATSIAPNNEVPSNPCAYMGRALPPSAYATAGQAAKWNPVTAVRDLSGGFKIGGYLDAQTRAQGNPFERAAYGNYAYGVWMAASGTPLFVALAGANEIAFIHKYNRAAIITSTAVARWAVSSIRLSLRPTLRTSRRATTRSRTGRHATDEDNRNRHDAE